LALFPDFVGAVGRARADFIGAAWAAGLADFGGWSPNVLLSGQTLNTGHLAQPTAMATGQIFMGTFSDKLGTAQYAPQRCRFLPKPCV